MKAVVALAVKKWVEKLYAEETTTTTKVDAITGKIDPNAGMPIMHGVLDKVAREGRDVGTRRRPTKRIDRREKGGA